MPDPALASAAHRPVTCPPHTRSPHLRPPHIHPHSVRPPVRRRSAHLLLATAALVLVLALVTLVLTVAAPSAQAADTSRGPMPEQWEVTRSIGAELKARPAAVPDAGSSPTTEPAAGTWRGHTTVTHEMVRVGSAAPTQRLIIDVMLVRRTCDVAGCMETVLRTEPGAANARWSARLARATVTSTTTLPVRVRRYAVDQAGTVTDRILEDRVMQMRVALIARSTGGDYSSSFRSTGGGLVTVSRSRQVDAQVSVVLGGLRIESTSGSMSWSRRHTRPAAGMSAG